MPLDQYYNRFNPAQHYDHHLFRAGYVLQSAELNEIQSALQWQTQGIGDALFKDGDVVRDAKLIVNADTGVAISESGAVYLKGAVRGVPARTFTVPTTGTITAGLILIETWVTELEDPALRDPAVGVRNYQEPGAGRLKLEPYWSYAGEIDAPAGEFYPIYSVVNGIVQSKEPPPQMDAITTALSRYDRDSSGGYYIINGLKVDVTTDLPTGEQVYTIQEGQARVNGNPVTLPTSLREVYNAIPDLKSVDSEPHTAAGGTERVNFDFSPLSAITQVRIIAEKTVTIIHGGYSGALDSLPDSSVMEIISVIQGGTTYTQGTDYKRTGNQVDWSLTGAEVAPGSTYNVTYRHITTITPTLIDSTGCTVSGAVPSTLIQLSYQWKMPRLDRLCLNDMGQLVWVKGMPHEKRPSIPSVPAGLLLLATVYQDWLLSARHIRADGIRMITMSQLESINQRLDDLSVLIAEQRLLTDANISEPTAKKGIFVDPFMDDDLRDKGIEQTGAIFNNELTLGMPSKVHATRISTDVVTLTVSSLASLISQLTRTGSMKVNPYMAFEPIPASVVLTPAIDYWTESNTTYIGDVIDTYYGSPGYYWNGWHWNNWYWWYYNGFYGYPYYYYYYGYPYYYGYYPRIITTSSYTQTVSSKTENLPYLRAIQVVFNITGFGAGEHLNKITFDDITVVATA